MHIDFTPIFVLAFIGLVAVGGAIAALAAVVVSLPFMLWAHSFAGLGDTAMIGFLGGAILTGLYAAWNLRP